MKSIEAETGARIHVDDDGIVLIHAKDGPAAKLALARVHQAAGVLRKGASYRGTVTGVRDFGAFVRVNRVNEGLIPKGEIDERGDVRPEDILKEGDAVVVMVLGTDGQGRIRLSRKRALGIDEALIEA